MLFLVLDHLQTVSWALWNSTQHLLFMNTKLKFCETLCRMWIGGSCWFWSQLGWLRWFFHQQQRLDFTPSPYTLHLTQAVDSWTSNRLLYTSNPRLSSSDSRSSFQRICNLCTSFKIRCLFSEVTGLPIWAEAALMFSWEEKALAGLSIMDSLCLIL